MGTRAALLVALVAALLMTGCADFYRSLGLDERPPGQDDGSRSAEDNDRRDKQVEALTQKVQQMSDALDRMSKSVAALSDKAAQDPGADLATRRRAGGSRPEQSAECAWIGQRTITVLMNDDLIAAESFTRLYGLFYCPMEHLAQAFACVVPAAMRDRAQADAVPVAPKPGETTESAAAARREAQLAAADRRDKRIGACWSNPRANNP